MKEQNKFNDLFHNIIEKQSDIDYGVMKIGYSPGNQLNLLLRRFERELAREKGKPSFSAILYLKDPREKFHARAEVVAILYGLKPTEARLVVALSAGDSIKEAALRLGMTEQTVRTYVKRIMQKTGTHRQVDLIQLIRSGLAVMV